MEIKLKSSENIDIIYDVCPCCSILFNQGKNKKTSNHAIPKFMNPKAEITHTLCLSCHRELNSYYRTQEIAYQKNKTEPSSFEEFKENYNSFRESFYNKKINRGQFGEKLWSNLMAQLEDFENRLNKLEKKK